MNQKIPAIAIVVALAMSACVDSRDYPVEDDTAGNRACTVTLVPHTGEDAIDREISRAQQRARTAPRPVPYLERLGWAYVGKARVSFDNGFLRLAEQAAYCIDSHEPGSLDALLLLGHVLHQLHDFHGAESVARQLVAQRGRWFDHALLGDALLEQGSLEEAIDAYQRMMNERPGPQAYVRAGRVRWLKGDVTGAIEMLRMAARAASLKDSEAAAWIRLELGRLLWQQGEESEAASIANDALALLPDYPPALLLLGRMHLASAEVDEAIPLLSRAAELDPLPEYMWALSEAYRITGRTEEHARVTERLASGGATEDPRTYSLYLATMGAHPETAVDLATEELSKRQDVFTLDAAAWALQSAGRTREAYALVEQALVEGTSDARLFFHAGIIAAAAGHEQDAKKLFEQARGLEHTLLPVERERLATEFAALEPQKANLVSAGKTLSTTGEHS